MKRTILFLMALIMSAGFAFAQIVLPSSSNVTGVYIPADFEVAKWYGANIILGSDADQWPWSNGVSGDAEEGVAFTPKKDATYHMEFNVTSSGAEGFRVRWLKDNTAGSYTAKDNDPNIVSSHPYAADETATFIPAYFSSTIKTGETKTYSVDFTMDGSQEPEELVGNLAIRGQYGSNDFVINTIVIGDADGNMLVNYDKDAITGIIQVKSEVSNVYNTDGGIIVNANNENVIVYAIDGRLVKQVVANQGTGISLAQGLYIVKVGANKAVKVVVK